MEKWVNQNGLLVKVFSFNDFKEAVNFVNKVARLAEKMNHHPDIEIFSFNKVRIKLTTHDEGNKVTEKDINLSKEIDEIL